MEINNETSIAEPAIWAAQLTSLYINLPRGQKVHQLFHNGMDEIGRGRFLSAKPLLEKAAKRGHPEAKYYFSIFDKAGAFSGKY